MAVSNISKVLAVAALLTCGVSHADQTPIHFQQATKPEQVTGCKALGEFSAPDKSWGAYRKLKQLSNAGFNRALLVSTDGAVVHEIAYHCDGVK
jgi:hypothetical protein